MYHSRPIRTRSTLKVRGPAKSTGPVTRTLAESELVSWTSSTYFVVSDISAGGNQSSQVWLGGRAARSL